MCSLTSALTCAFLSVPIDRDAALNEAEQLLREGKLDGAIEAHVRLVENRPNPAKGAAPRGSSGFDLDSGGYRDGRTRIDRLMLAQAGSPGQ